MEIKGKRDLKMYEKPLYIEKCYSLCIKQFRLAIFSMAVPF